MLPSEEIKEKINIVDLIGEYVPLKKAGVNFRTLCPFHQEKTPSFMVSPAKQIWHCFGCNFGGDHFEFIKQIEGVEFPEALEILASRAGVVLRKPTIEYKKEVDQKKVLLAINELATKYYAAVLEKSQVAQAARQYLQKRGLKAETVQKWQIGFAPEDFHAFEEFIVKKGYQRREAVAAGLLVEKDDGTFFDRFHGRIMFPLFDIHGRVVGFTARILDEGPSTSSGSTTAKYINSPETLIYNKSQLLYGLHLAKTEIRKVGEVIIVEGNIDVITCHEAAPSGGQAGFANVVGSSGTALTMRQLELLQRFTNNLSFALDTDEAGLQATRRAVELALSVGFDVRIIAIPKALAKDPDELIRKDRSLWEQQVNSAKNFLDFYFEATFANLDLDSNVAKKQAVATLLPLLSLLPDPIDRTHYVQKLAAKLGLDERLVAELLNKRLAASRAAKVGTVVQYEPIRKMSKQELLERRVLGLLLKFGKNLQSEFETIKLADFSMPVLQEIFASLEPEIKTENFDLPDFVGRHPKLAAEIELLVFAVENELTLAVDLNLEDLKRQFLTNFRQFTTKRKMQELASRIKAAEVLGHFEEAKLLSSEFNNLTVELSKYSHAS